MKSAADCTSVSLSHLGIKERRFHEYLAKRKISAFAPIEMAKAMKVSNRTIINWCAALCKVGLLEPEVVGSRIRSYKVIE